MAAGRARAVEPVSQPSAHPHAKGSDRDASTKLRPIAFSKRLGLRAWRKLRASLADLHREVQVSFESSTVETLFGALQQSDQPMLHFLPTRDYDRGVTMESYEGELKPLPLAQVRRRARAAQTHDASDARVVR